LEECQLLPLARPVRTVQNGPTTLVDFQTKTTHDLSRLRFTTTLGKRLSGATIRRPEPSAWANLLFDHVLRRGSSWDLHGPLERDLHRCALGRGISLIRLVLSGPTSPS
jgi:hypothetical protein